MNQFDARAISGRDRLVVTLGTPVSYTALDEDGGVSAGYPKTVDAIVRRETTMHTYEGDGDIVTQTIKIALPNADVAPKIGDYLAVEGVEYAVTEIEMQGPALTTVTAERTYNARVGAPQGFVR